MMLHRNNLINIYIYIYNSLEIENGKQSSKNSHRVFYKVPKFSMSG